MNELPGINTRFPVNHAAVAGGFDDPGSCFTEVANLALCPVRLTSIEMRTNSSGDLIIKSLPTQIKGKFNLVIDRTNLFFNVPYGEPNSSKITDKMCEQVTSAVKFVTDNRDSPYLKEMAKQRRMQVRQKNGIRIDLFPTRLNNSPVYVELARQQGIEMNTAPVVVNLPTITDLIGKVKFHEKSLSSQIGEVSEFDPQIRAMNFRGSYLFDRYNSDLASADLICDLRNGDVLVELEMKVSFKDGEGQVKAFSLTSEMKYE
jgi:hypothetical protein